MTFNRLTRKFVIGENQTTKLEWKKKLNEAFGFNFQYFSLGAPSDFTIRMTGYGGGGGGDKNDDDHHDDDDYDGEETNYKERREILIKIPSELESRLCIITWHARYRNITMKGSRYLNLLVD